MICIEFPDTPQEENTSGNSKGLYKTRFLEASSNFCLLKFLPVNIVRKAKQQK